MKLEYIDGGEIVSTHGVRGEMKVLPWLDEPQMLCEFERCHINGKEYGIESCRVQKNCNLLKLEGIDTMEDAQAMRGKTIQLYREDVDDEIIFAAELHGVEVYCDGVRIGTITNVLAYPGNCVYVVGTDTNQDEYMIPAVKEFILSTDLQANQMQVKLIEGMRTNEN